MKRCFRIDVNFDRFESFNSMTTGYGSRFSGEPLKYIKKAMNKMRNVNTKTLIDDWMMDDRDDAQI
jgi:hypothetical protein